MRTRLEIGKRITDIGFVPHLDSTIMPGDSFVVWPYGLDPILLTCKATSNVYKAIYATETPYEYAMADCVKVTC